MKNRESNYKANREALKQISQNVKPLVKEGYFESVNSAILATYRENGNEEFNTFGQWLEKGFAVKKGERAFLVWGTPKRLPVINPESEKDEFDYFPLCYLFSNKQVEAVKERENKKVSDVQIVYKSKIAPQNREEVGDSFDAVRIAKSLYKPEIIEHHECFYMLMLNRANKVLGAAQISEGGISGTITDTRIIMQYALLSNASSIIISHNHPSGNINPSTADINITKKINEACKILDLKLLDHLIITSENYYSLADNGLID
jgi:DNA repair protein RadC